ncbi:MAG: MBL fold metallo-hydrolase [Planctomycetaceae bacterium]|nr:MBL fold metallo-hydrolase [Planctomycetaceae bacterium]
MTKLYLTLLLTLCIVPLGLAQESAKVHQLPERVSFVVNRVPPDFKTDGILLTDVHQDVAKDAERSGTKLVVIGEQEKKYLVDPQGSFWNDYLAKGRFNEESCASTDRPFVPIRLPDVEIRGVKDGDVVEMAGFKFHVLETPGMGRGSVSYYDDMGGRRSVYTGDLICGDGKIANLYDLQDNFSEADIDSYHGFMARAPKLIASLEKIRALKPDILIPAKGWTIENPNEAIDALIGRLRAVYRNYLSTSALWWYFGEKRMNASAAAILENDFDPKRLDRMPEATKFENPDWLTGFSTTRMIRSETGDVFLMDVNSDREADRIIEMHKNGEIGKVTGIFITHYHHDHNTGVPKVAKFFSAPVYGVEPLADILERPGAYRMPCLQNISIPIVRKNDGETMQWNEFEFTFFDFPGQTLYHNALLVRKGNERPVFFIGDSFTPTGIDDYCAWNRNLLKDGKGYLYCLKKIRSLNPSPILINAHVEPPFEFDTMRLDYMERALRERIKLLADLLAVPEINFGLDHAWCRLDPFVSTIPAGKSTVLKLVITNHFDKVGEFLVKVEPDEAFSLEMPQEPIRELTVEPGKEQTMEWTLKPTSNQVGTRFVSAKVMTDDGSLFGHCEAVVQIQ